MDKVCFDVRIVGDSVSDETLDHIINELPNRTIYFNDTTCRYWLFDFLVDNVWCSMVSTDDPWVNGITIRLENLLKN